MIPCFHCSLQPTRPLSLSTSHFLFHFLSQSTSNPLVIHGDGAAVSSRIPAKPSVGDARHDAASSGTWCGPACEEERCEEAAAAARVAEPTTSSPGMGCRAGGRGGRGWRGQLAMAADMAMATSTFFPHPLSLKPQLGPKLHRF